MAANRRILFLRHADPVQTTFGQSWLNYYDPTNNGLKMPANTPYNYDFTPVPDVNLPTCLPFRNDGFDAWAGDPCLSESGKLCGVAVGQYLRKAKITPDMFGRRIYCSPAYAAVETTSAIIDGLLDTSKDKIDICVEYGLFTYPSRFRIMPSFVEISELGVHYTNRVNVGYRSVVSKAKLSVKETLASFYARNREITTKLLTTHKAKYMLIVAHGSNMEGVSRTLRQMPLLDELNFNRCVEGIPYLADACFGEEKVGNKIVWKLAESPLLRFSQVGNERQEDWSWLNMDEKKLKEKFK